MTVTYNVYRSDSPMDLENMPIAIKTGLASKSYTDSDISDNHTYYYRVGAEKYGVEKISSEISIHIDLLTIAATFAPNGSSINGTSLKNANITVTIDPDLSAHFSSDGRSMSGKSLANAQITVTI